MFKLITAILMAYILLFFWYQLRPPKVVQDTDGLYVYGKDVVASYGLLGAFTVLSYAFLTGVIS